MNKYKLTNETITVGKNIILYRIEACKSFHGVKRGTKGGFVQNYSNLSQHGKCWIYDDAKVYQDANVSENAIIRNEAIIKGKARIYGNAIVCDKVIVSENAIIGGDSMITDHARIKGECSICGYACITHYAKIYGSSVIIAHAYITNKARIYGNAHIGDFSYISDTVEVFGNTLVDGNTMLVGDAKVSKNSDYQTFRNTWSHQRWFTWTKSNDKWSIGCFYGTSQELIDRAYKDSKEKGDYYKLYVELVENLKKLD